MSKLGVSRGGTPKKELWYRLVATVPIRPLAWEPPYATGVALKKRDKTKQKKSKKQH